MEHQNVLTKAILANVKQTEIELDHFLHVINKQINARTDEDDSSLQMSTSEFSKTESKSSSEEVWS